MAPRDAACRAGDSPRHPAKSAASIPSKDRNRGLAVILAPFLLEFATSWRPDTSGPSCSLPTWIFVARRSRRHSAVSVTTFRRSPGRSMQSHRDWLLAQHGSTCAYCGVETSSEAITLDHVRPRRGQTAYDRADNLVLACRDC